MQNRIDSVALALQEICETKALLQSLIVSSERFDYFKAKHCLSELQKKVEALAEIEAQLSKRLSAPENITVVDFRDIPSA